MSRRAGSGGAARLHRERHLADTQNPLATRALRV